MDKKIKVNNKKFVFFVLDDEEKKTKFNKKYAVACIYNNNKTKVKDIKSGKIYELKKDQTGEYVEIGNKRFSKVTFVEKDNKKVYSNNNVIANKNSYAYNLVLTHFYSNVFCESQEREVTLPMAKNFVDGLNADIHNHIKKLLNNEKHDMFDF